MNKNKEPVSRKIPSDADTIVAIRFKPEEWAVVGEDIAASGLNKNVYFRKLALDAPAPRKAQRQPSGLYGPIYSQWLGQLGKIGGNVNQISRHLNASRKAGDAALCPSNAEVLAVLEEVLLVLQQTGQEVRIASVL